MSVECVYEINHYMISFIDELTNLFLKDIYYFRAMRDNYQNSNFM